MNRKDGLRKLRTDLERYDIVIVGGGATGLGTAVDAASRGYRTLLVEKSDFAKGTSSRSTKLVHGGVRYLRQGNVGLVLDALKERGLMKRNAPHLVKDLEFIIPGYQFGQATFYGLGMKVYEAMAGKRSFGKSRMISREETLSYIPTIESDRLRGGVLYHDGQFDDARLAISLAQTAEDLGATVLNYANCIGLLKEGEQVTGIKVRDEESGDVFDVMARAVVNATGVFVDDLMGKDTHKKSELVAVSQGIHFVLPKRFLPGNHALMIPKTEDGRVLFAIPWHNCVVVGTTDTPVKTRTLEPIALEEERTFVLEHARKYLSEDPTEADVLSVFAGLRPLVRKGGAKATSQLSRDHTVLISSSGLITITGGKWTTYRKMAEDVVGCAIQVGSLRERPCVTETLKIHGWVSEETHMYPLSVYGSDAPRVGKIGLEDPNAKVPIHPRLPYTKAEVIWQARNEMARTPEDVLARRTRSLFLDAAASIEAAPVVAKILASELDQNEEWQRKQIEAYQKVAKNFLFGS